MKFKSLLTLGIAIMGIFLCNDLTAQDPRFAQFYAAPLNLNPAMTGVFEGRFRVTANYREQWSSILSNTPFRTYGAGFDIRYKIASDDYFAFGFNALRDEVGDSRFSQTLGYLNLAYLKQISGGGYRSADQYLVAGVQIGGGQNSLEWNRLWFSEQFDISTATPNPDGLSNNEIGLDPNNNGTNNYLDFNAGLMWYASFDDNKSIYVGAAANHLNAPNIAFFEGASEVLNVRWVGHAGGELPFTDEMSIMPAIAVMVQGPSTSTTFGANIRYSNHDWYEVAIRAGLWGHLVNKLESGSSLDALTFAVILEMERWNLGVSYDINTSNLTRATNARGAFELSLIYTQPAKTRVRVNCPNF